MTRKITLKNERETVVIENDNMEIIVKELVDKYTTRHNRSKFEQVIIYKTKYILDYNELEDEDELILFIECLTKYMVEKESKDTVIIYVFLKDQYDPTFMRIN